MKTFPKKKSLTFGAYIAAIYATCGKRKAREIIRQAVNSRLVVFPEQRRFEIA
jgi:dsRNA-specific ribonuclease